MNKFLILCAIFTSTSLASAQDLFYRSVNVGSVNRQYLVYLPDNFDPSENMPVMFHFHGGDGSPESAMKYELDFRQLADTQRFIAVYPAALLDNTNCTCWNNEGKYSNGIDELGFAVAMTDAIVNEFNADENRLYASGFSLGGSLMWDYACYLSDRFAGIGVIAANMWQWTENDCNSPLPIGICHILGTNDFYAPYNGNQYSISVAEQNDFWVSANGSETTPIETPLGGNVTQYLWPAGDSCHEYMHYRRQGGGHDIPSFATQAIWDFVSQYELDGITECGDTCPADINDDSYVNVSDLLFIIENWGQTNSPADINEDGVVAITDLLVIIDSWGACN